MCPQVRRSTRWGGAVTPPSAQQNVNPTSVNHKVSVPDVANDVNGTNSGRQPNGSLSQHDSDQINGSLDEQKQQMPNAGPRKHETTSPTQRQKTAHDGASSVGASSAQARGPVSMAKGDTSASQPEVMSSVITSNGRDPSEKAASNSSEAGSKVHQDHDSSAQNAASGPGTEILPYVIHEERAYQLPISLKLTSINTKSVPPEHDLAIELAFLNAGQLRTLQRLLQYRGETGARKLIRLEVAKKPARRFWQRPRRVTVAFVEGEASGMPVSILPHGDASHRQLKDVDQLGQGSLPSRIGLPNFQDVTNDLINDIVPWNQRTDRERFTEYRVWHIEPFSASEAGGESTKDWARSLLREENLPRTEIKRRLRILDKDPSTVIAKSTMLTPAQQFQVWRSLEAAKLGEPDPGYQWTLRQLEVIWSRRFFVVKQAKAIIVYVAKAPEFPYNDTLDDVTQNAPKINPHNDSHDVDASDGSLLERRRRAIDHANNLIASRPRPLPPPPRPRPLSPPRQILTTVAGADPKTEDELAREREDELVREIQRLEHQIKQSHELEEESERRSQITLETQRRARSERHNKPDWVEQKPLPIGASASLVRERRELDVEEPHISTRAAETPPRYRDTSREGSPRNRASVRFLERSRSNTSRQQDTRTRYPSQFDRSRFDPRPPERSDAETSEDEMVASHIERFQKRHNRPSAPSRSVARSVARSGAESQYAVEQLLLEWTPAQIRDSDDEDNAGSEVNSENGDAGDIILQSVREETDQRGRLTMRSDARLDGGEYESDTGSEEYMMAKESPTRESSLVSRREQAEGDQIGTKVDDDQQNPGDGEKALHGVPPPTVDDAGDRQNSLEHDEQATHDGAMPRSRGAPWIPIPGPISNSPQQLSRPSSKNTNADRAGEEIPKGASQTQGRQKTTAQKPDGTARLFQRGKKLARASTLPQASRQPWSDEDWARQIVEETAETARTSDYEAQPDRLKARRASFHFTAPRPRGQESKSKSRDDFWDMPAPPRKRP
ncbi:hypothetical protein NUW58_g2339 [Xylaria curta]|uniref:Uncharacterized protein n=1 Tax=Xylaria curta TaxID=42375 RepID=A0ACC1PIR1_9PEZI|nr:hypothetical protein NUW58_g2339 [Xylaria curta]